jgi:DNA-binding response OmpR family regulator
MLKVLIVDDEPSYREYLERYLSRSGYEVRSASGAAEAVAIARELRPDVVLADWML